MNRSLALAWRHKSRDDIIFRGRNEPPRLVASEEGSGPLKLMLERN